MGKMSEKRRMELQSNYGDNAFKPISDEYMKKARSLSAKYILFVNKDNKHGYCEKCCKDVEFKKTRHKALVDCPNCGTTLIAQHTWRKPKCEWDTEWFTVGQLVDEDTFALRYIKAEHNPNYLIAVNELAREIYDFKHGWSYRFSYTYGYNYEYWENDGSKRMWRVNNSYYFTEFNMGGWYRRKNCCIGAESLNDIRTELKGLKALKYFDQLDGYYGVYTYARDNIRQLLNATLYEKLEKVGLGKIAREDYDSYYETLKYKRTETSLVKMLGINKSQYKLVLKYPSRVNLIFIKRNKDMPIDKAEYIICHDISMWNSVLNMSNVSNKFKTYKYLVKNKINSWEYSHYLYTLKELNYKLDESYMYPKDFRKEDKRLTDEWNAKRDEERLKKLSKQSALMKKISDGLRNMPDLQEFIGGSRGLLVYVPESARELMEEGKALHNCLSTYTDRIAQGKTLVFFVRKLDTPNAPFVAFEYCNGEVVQCRYDHNENVTDEKVIDFVEAFAQKLRDNKVLYKAA